MQKKKEASIILSLRQEIEREVQEIEKEMARHPELDEIQVTEEMDRALFEKIQAYEKEVEAKRRAEEMAGDDSRRVWDESALDEDVDSFEGLAAKGVANISGRYGNSGNTVEFSEELVPDLSGRVVRGIGESRKDVGEGKEGKVLYRRKKRKYWAVSLVAVLVIVLGVGVNSVGSKSYWKMIREIFVDEAPINVINVEEMEKRNTEDVDELTAYREIKEKFKIEPVKIMYKPDDMELADYEIYEEMLSAQLLYKYQDDVVRYILYVNSADSSWGGKEEDTKIDEYVISVNDIKIKVEEFEKPNRIENRQVARFKYQGVEYQLIGVMKKEEFKKILDNLYFYKEKA